MKMQFIILNLLLYTSLPYSCFSQTKVPSEEAPSFYKRTSYLSDNPKKSDLDVLVDSVVRSYMQSSEHCGLSIAISKNNVDYFYNYGETKRGTETIPVRSTIYEIGGISSTFCGFLLEEAIQEKKINAEEDIRHYLPEKLPALQYNKKPILIKHLANHTSGLPAFPDNIRAQENYDPSDPYSSYTSDLLFDYLKTYELTKAPGTSTEYSIIGYALLGIALEKEYNKPFEELVKEKINGPLKLSHTAINLNTEQKQKLAAGYTLNGDTGTVWTLGIFEPSGGLRSSPEDLLCYLNFKLKEKTGSAIGWQVSKTRKGNTLYSQSGGTLGYGAFIGFIKNSNCAVSLLCNNGLNLEFLAIPLLHYLQE